jgi:hypothetical protein
MRALIRPQRTTRAFWIAAWDAAALRPHTLPAPLQWTMSAGDDGRRRSRGECWRRLRAVCRTTGGGMAGIRYRWRFGCHASFVGLSLSLGRRWLTTGRYWGRPSVSFPIAVSGTSKRVLTRGNLVRELTRNAEVQLLSPMKLEGVFTTNRDQQRTVMKNSEAVWHSAFRLPVRYMRNRRGPRIY